ncbi:unnamed protein product [Ectocarpus sp. 4 AP-2014]
MRSSAVAFAASCAAMLASSGAFLAPSFNIGVLPRSASSRSTNQQQQHSSERAVARRATSPSMSSLVITLEDDVIDKPLQPVGNYILVKMFAAVSRTAGGIVLPDEAQDVPCEGLVVAHGPGRTHPLTGTLIPMCVSEGDTVLFSRWSGRKVKYCGEDHMFIMDDDLVLVYRGPELTEDSLKMVRDQVLVVTEKGESETDAGIVIAASTAEKEKASQGRVVAIGEGRTGSTGEIVPCPFKAGDNVKFMEYAPVEIKIKGSYYAVVRMVDCIARWEGESV